MVWARDLSCTEYHVVNFHSIHFAKFKRCIYSPQAMYMRRLGEDIKAPIRARTKEQQGKNSKRELEPSTFAISNGPLNAQKTALPSRFQLSGAIILHGNHHLPIRQTSREFFYRFRLIRTSLKWWNSENNKTDYVLLKIVSIHWKPYVDVWERQRHLRRLLNREVLIRTL